MNSEETSTLIAEILASMFGVQASCPICGTYAILLPVGDNHNYICGKCGQEGGHDDNLGKLIKKAAESLK